MVAVHIAQRLDIPLLADGQLFFQTVNLQAESGNLRVKVSNVVADGVDGATLASNLGVDHHEVLQPFLDVVLRRSQPALLFFDILLQLFALFLQVLDGSSLRSGSALLLRLLSSRALLDGGGTLRFLFALLGKRRFGHEQAGDE